MAKKINEWDFKVQHAYTRIICTKDEHCKHYSGSVVTPFGIVGIYADIYVERRERNYVSFDCVVNGRAYHRAIRNYTFTRTGVARMAHRWIKELSQKG